MSIWRVLTITVFISGLTHYQAIAFPAYKDLLVNTVQPHAKLRTCGTCHVNKGGGGPRNLFGEDFEENGMSAVALISILQIDSDGDGATNEEELKVGTFPGDRNDVQQQVERGGAVFPEPSVQAKNATPSIATRPKKMPYEPAPGVIHIYDGNIVDSPVGLRLSRWGTGGWEQTDEFGFNTDTVLLINTMSRSEGVSMEFDDPPLLDGDKQNHYLVMWVRFPPLQGRLEEIAAGINMQVGPGRSTGRSSGAGVGLPGAGPNFGDMVQRMRSMGREMPPEAMDMIRGYGGVVPEMSETESSQSRVSPEVGLGNEPLAESTAAAVAHSQEAALSVLRLVMLIENEEGRGWAAVNYGIPFDYSYGDKWGWTRISVPLSLAKGFPLKEGSKIRRIIMTGDADDDMYVGYVALVRDDEPYLKGSISATMFSGYDRTQSTSRDEILKSQPIFQASVGQSVTMWVKLSSEAPMAKVQWDLSGDGIYDKVGLAVRHVFQQPGTFTISALIEDIYRIKKPQQIEAKVRVY